MIRSACEFDKQMLDFTFNVDMASGSPEFECVQDQRPIALTLEAVGGEIESGQNYRLKVIINIAKYRSTQPVLVNDIWQFAISGKALFDVSANKLYTVELTNDVTNYANAF